MEEGRVEHTVDVDTRARPAPRGRWRRLSLYLLAALGVVAVAAGLYKGSTGTPAPTPTTASRPAIDEAAVIDGVMTEHYGKYSAAQRGWLFVGDDDRTYVMRVIQQTKLSGAGGDELYFMASGAPINDEPDARLGAFHVRPDPDRPGRFLTSAAPSMPGGTFAVAPEDVEFAAFSTQLRGWIVEVREGYDGEDLHAADIRLLAPHGNDIVELATFPASRAYDDAGPECESLPGSGEAAAGADARTGATQDLPPDAEAAGMSATEAAASSVTEAESASATEAADIYRCQQRRWTYRLGSAKGKEPGAISVTAGGTLEGQPVPARTWTLRFDAGALRYIVPKELKEAAY